MTSTAWRIVVMLVVFGIVVLTGGGPAAAQKQEIVIGYALSLTGRFSTEAQDSRRGYEFWRDQVNKAGGLLVKEYGKRLPVRFVEYDDASDPSNAVKFYERLATVDKVDLVLSPWGSGINFAVTAVTEKHRYPMMLSSGSSDKLYSRGFKYVFSNTQLASMQGVAMVELLKTFKDRLKTVAVLYENFLFTLTIHDALIAGLKTAGFELVLDEQYPLGGKDFAGILVRVKSLKPDAILVLNIMPSSLYVTKQAGELGIKSAFFLTTIGPMYKEFREGVGALAESVFESGYWDQGLPFKGAREFQQEMVKRYGRAANDAAMAYIGAQILGQAVEAAGTLDREAVARAIRGGRFETIGGLYEYDERGVNKQQTLYVVQSQGPNQVIVWPPAFANGSARLGWPKDR